MTATETAWLAGLLEGEGCFSITGRNRNTGRRYVGIYLVSTDKDVVERAAGLMGVRVQTLKHMSDVSRKQQYRAVVNGGKACAIMREVLPWLGTRRSERVNELLSIYSED